MSNKSHDVLKLITFTQNKHKHVFDNFLMNKAQLNG